ISTAGAKGVLFSIAGGDDLTMFEIQDAAKVITESIDPNAKVIFGTVRDEKLKKGEVKVTVIATGFGDGPVHPATKAKSLFSGPSESKEEKKEKEEAKKQIHNTAVPKEDKASIPTIDRDDDDWGAVPAFLRRKK